jgi:long-subunit fatty acid transport protein
MIRIFSLSVVLLSFSSIATELPALPSQTHDSPHKLFLSSESDQQGFDTWKIDGGYSYNVFDKIDLYVGARVNKSDFNNETGFLSGVSYQISPRVSVKSTLHSYHEEKTIEQGKESVIAAEVSSRMRLTENIDIHATLDYQEWQQGLEVGLGFRF